ncbi:MAG: hypothetical protein CMO80_00470 [Verrucomicrobiales bacterium]|nr:hypothetical protein [Verrucomicrobiales bacterium]
MSETNSTLWLSNAQGLPLALFAYSVLFSFAVNTSAGPDYAELKGPPHNYWTRPLNDRFTELKAKLEAGSAQLKYTSERDTLASILEILEVPKHSQLLLFSTTSLQLSLISPRNPRAIYFNEDLYIGFIPRGRIEVVAMNPELGGVFFIFDIPRRGESIRVERSTRCMNCHASEDTGEVPGLLIKSVIPGPNSGSLTAYRIEESGHAIPFSERFGGWHVTGEHQIKKHWGNLVGRFQQGKLITTPNPPGRKFTYARYPVRTSDILPHLLFEHQTGFVNRVLEAGYRARTYRHSDGNKLTTEHELQLARQAEIVLRYLLFADEVPLPSPGVTGVDDYKTQFRSNRRSDSKGRSLKDFDLKTRMFQHRCSYMVHSAVFQGLEKNFKQRVFTRLKSALADNSTDLASEHLPPQERRAIREILSATVKDLPATW